jgi:hypothetical protein
MARKQWTIILLVAALALAGAAAAGDYAGPRAQHEANRSLGNQSLPAGVVGTAKADADTVFLLGGPDAWNGRFENNIGQPMWHDWTSEDFTYDPTMAWNISSERVLNGARSMVCGTLFEFSDGTSDFGYGNGWYKYLVFSHPVPDPQANCTIRLTGTMTYDTEEDYDYVYLQVYTSGGWADLGVWDGERPLRPVTLDYSYDLTPVDYQGGEAKLRWNFTSDIGWSDEDGLYDSDGPCWLDDLGVYMDGTLVDLEDFEDDDPGYWQEELSGGVGDFAALYDNLQDLDPCVDNDTWQVAFIDDGLVVPGTGGSPCITYCYGPGGYVVNSSGGLLGPDSYLENGVKSPYLTWPEGCEALTFEFGVYRHEEMLPSSTGIFYRWFVRSTTSDNPADLELELWETNNSFYMGSPAYRDNPFDVTTYVTPGRKYVQVMLMAHEFGWYWDVTGSDGTPAPYFDNVRVMAIPFNGPAMSYDALFLAEDNFPEIGVLDLAPANLANNHIRFDCCYNIAPAADLRNDPGDSLTINVTPARAGSVLEGMPQMVVRMKANPLFDGVRTLPTGFSQSGDIITGVVEGDTVIWNNQVVEDRYCFDLPDTGFFYPGDVIHYYFEAWDNQAGDVGHTMLPADTAGFASFHHDLHYPSEFVSRGLPTVRSLAEGDQPKILFWNDFGSRGGENEWYHAFNGCGLEEGVDYDVYHTNRPDAGEGNGLGGRASSAVLSGYETLIYTCGDLSGASLGNGDYANEASQDIQVLDNWFSEGGKKALMTGDDLVYDLTQKGSAGQAFINDYFGVQLEDRSLVDFIGGQVTPSVSALTGNGVFTQCVDWVAFGGCPDINTFDAVTPQGTTVALAEFLDSNGNGGVYDYAAASYRHNNLVNSDVILMPYDFIFVYNAPGYVPPPSLLGLPARTVMLRDILNFFGYLLPAPIGVGDTPVPASLAVSAYPNPFNPRTNIKLTLPRADHVTVKIFDVRGALVRTLQDDVMEAGVHNLVWDGSDDRGARSASGVYFAETRTLGQSRVTRMAMIK